MKIKLIAAIVALVAVIALFSTCGSSYSSPEGWVKGAIGLNQNLVEAIQSCTADDISPFTEALDDSVSELNDLREAFDNMTVGERAEVKVLLANRTGKYYNEAKSTGKALEAALQELFKVIDDDQVKDFKESVRNMKKELSEMAE